MALVKFVSTDTAKFAALPSKDADTLYFVSDQCRIYKGDVAYSGGIYEAVSEFPALPQGPTAYAAAASTAKPNVLYLNTNTGEVRYFDGSTYKTLVKPFSNTVTNDENLVTGKAVTAYVASQIQALDKDGLLRRLSIVEGDISNLKKADETIRAEISAAKSEAIADAQKKVNDLANGQVATNKTDITTLKSGKADKANTIKGYGITDAYTKTETDSQINQAIANADHLKREIVERLPEISAANEHTIYMVKKGTGTDKQKYDEYMLISTTVEGQTQKSFEKIGDSAVDLQGYATETFVNNKIAELDVADTAVEGQYVSAVSEADGKIKVTRAALPKVDTLTEGTANGTVAFNNSDVKVHGLNSAAYVNVNTLASAAQGAKADSALQANDVVTGTDNGTIKVKGTSVAVHGLGSAAYANSEAFDGKGAANQAKIDAIADAEGKIRTVKSEAAADAKNKADAAQQEAIKQAKAYAEQLLSWTTL